MSDCRVPMPTFSKDLVKSEDCKDDLPPIPEGWMAYNFHNATIRLTHSTSSPYKRDMIDLPFAEMNIQNVGDYENINYSFNPFECQKLEVLVLIKECE